MSELPESSLVRWIPLLPLIAALLQGLLLGVFRRPLGRSLVIGLSCGAAGLAFAVTCAAFAELVSLSGEPRALLDYAYTWIDVAAGGTVFRADVALIFDPLSSVMCLVVTGVGFLIHVYAVGYMAGDERADGGYPRFFCYLNLFLASMLLLVLAENMLLMFVGWEGVGLCSYLLIGFWYAEEENAYAGAKAFIVNRIGDFALLVGLMLLFWTLADAGAPTLSFRGVEAHFDRIADLAVTAPAFLYGVFGDEWKLPTLIGLCLFVGACGKSAQLPLSVWLPDAMAGPTPVSALIHAATMVTAGVYLVCRMSFLYAAAPGASALICWVGAATALWAAAIACAQNDIKKVLAYSTVSQLGTMFLAVGSGAFSVAIFHVVTHAFFKALLFMGAGVVILALHHEQNLRKMGGLRSRLPRTYWVMLIGVAAIGGVPLLSGFFSKDAILLAMYLAHDVPGHLLLYASGIVTAGITAFYAARLFCLVFLGTGRSAAAFHADVDRPANSLLWPLYVLAVLAVVGGMFGLPSFWGERLFGVESSDSLGNWLAGTLVAPPPHELPPAEEWRHIGFAVAATGLGFALAYFRYVRRPRKAAHLSEPRGWFYRLLEHKTYLDELYDRALVRPLLSLSERVLYRGIDVRVIDGVGVNGSARAVRAVANYGLKYAQSGLTQSYFFVMVLGTVVVVGYLVR